MNLEDTNDGSFESARKKERKSVKKVSYHRKEFATMYFNFVFANLNVVIPRLFNFQELQMTNVQSVIMTIRKQK